MQRHRRAARRRPMRLSLARVRRAARKAGAHITRRAVNRAAIVSLLILAAAGTLIALTAVSLAHESPPWWRSVDPNDPETIALAERVERAVMNAFHKWRPGGEPWSVSITARQANAWLNVKLPKWVASRRETWPESLGEIQTNSAPGRVSVGVVLRLDDDAQIVATTVRPIVRDDGSLWLEGARTRAGRLDIPSGWTVARLEQALPADLRGRAITTRLLRALQGRGPVMAEPAVELEDGRRVRLVEVEPNPGRLALTFVTERGDRSVVER